MIHSEELVKGIQDCDLNGGKIGNCPYKEIIELLKAQEKEIESLKEIIKNADAALETIKEEINALLYEDFRR